MVFFKFAWFSAANGPPRVTAEAVCSTDWYLIHFSPPHTWSIIEKRHLYIDYERLDSSHAVHLLYGILRLNDVSVGWDLDLSIEEFVFSLMPFRHTPTADVSQVPVQLHYSVSHIFSWVRICLSRTAALMRTFSLLSHYLMYTTLCTLSYAHYLTYTTYLNNSGLQECSRASHRERQLRRIPSTSCSSSGNRPLGGCSRYRTFRR